MIRFVATLSLALSPGARASTDTPAVCDDRLVPIVSVPGVPARLGDPVQRLAYTRELQTVLGTNSGVIGRSLMAAADSDDNFRALRAVAVTPGDSEQKSMLAIFADFNDLIESAAPPKDFTPSEAFRQADSTLRRNLRLVMKKFGVEKHLPPTVEQWLKIYANKAPDFEAALGSIQDAITDLQRRRTNSYGEIEALELVLAEAQRQADLYSTELENLKAQVARENLSGEALQLTEETCVNPLLNALLTLEEQIALYRMQIAQRFKFIHLVGPVIDETAAAATLAIPALKNAASIHGDALAVNKLSGVKPKLQELVRRSVNSTTDVLAQTASNVAKSVGTTIFTPEEAVAQFKKIAAVSATTKQNHQQTLPKLMKRIADFEQFNREAKLAIENLGVKTPRLEAPETDRP